ncbi:MAG TPA: pre-peptidase C-terminal domain-containing protein, partial [Terriglobales bacterium]|nr:pre-peptidase C-terminal domain-containing protein [Terriglobales bacterium]
GQTVNDNWTGQASVGTNPASDCAPVSTSPVDEHVVTVNVPAGTYSTVNALFTFQITWTPVSGMNETNDLILTVIGPDGQEINSSDGGEPKETVTISNPAPGNYRVQVCGFVNSSTQPYNGNLQITTTTGGTPPPVIISGPGKNWGAPVRITPTNGYGYEPTLLVDKYGNAFATAHKENVELAVSPDPNSPDGLRSQSWMWWSVDKGQKWINAPGLTQLALQDQEPGDEGDLAYDDAGHIYFADTYLGDITLTRWTSNGLGQVTYDFNRPIVPSPESDDRPWITAHGNGHIFYFSNDGSQAADGARYTVHASYDGGVTWDIPGKSLPNSGWCRPAADHRAGSKLVYAACTDDNGKLYSYVTTDDGLTWKRYDMGTYNDGDDTQSYPSIQVAPDGTVWVIYLDSNDIGDAGIPNTNRIYLFRSSDQGKTWTKQDITPVRGRYQYVWMAISADGKKMGLGTYFRPNNTYPWVVAGATWTPGGTIRAKDFLSLDPDHPVADANRTGAPGDYLGSFFFPDGKLGIVWTRSVLYTDQATLLRDIYFIRQK